MFRAVVDFALNHRFPLLAFAIQPFAWGFDANPHKGLRNENTGT